MWVARDPSSWANFWCFPMLFKLDWKQSSQVRTQTGSLVWDASVTSSGLTCCITVASPSFILYKEAALLRSKRENWNTVSHIFQVYYLLRFDVCLYLWSLCNKITSRPVTPESFLCAPLKPFFLASFPSIFSVPWQLLICFLSIQISLHFLEF